MHSGVIENGKGIWGKMNGNVGSARGILANPVHPHQVQPNLGAAGSFKVFTGEVAKIEKKGRFLYSWRNGVGKKTGIFLSSFLIVSDTK